MNLPNLSELKKIVSFCRKHGVSSLKSGDFELTLSPSALFPESQSKAKDTSPTSDQPVIENQYSEEDLLFWSSTPPGLSEGGN